MTNLYPFLMGQAALSHERIPTSHRLLIPKSCVCCSLRLSGRAAAVIRNQWTLRDKVLRIVDNNATAIDARLLKRHHARQAASRFNRITVLEASYWICPVSRFGLFERAVLRISNGHRLMQNISSHHYVLMDRAYLQIFR